MNKKHIFRKGKKILSLLLAFVLLLQPQLLTYAGEEAVILEDGALSDGTETVPDIGEALPESPPETAMPTPEIPPEATTPAPEIPEVITPIPESTPETPETITPTPESIPEPTVTEAPAPVPETMFPSDGSLAGQMMRFVDVSWEENSLGEIWAVFDGGTLERAELCMSPQRNGIYTAAIPAGDYSTVTFQVIGEKESAEELGSDVTETETPSLKWEILAGPWNYYGQEEAGENIVKFAPETMDTFYYNSKDSAGYWGAQQKEETADPSDGGLAGETLKFVNLYWETDDMGSVEAVFDGGEQEASVQVMNRGDRGVYETVIPEGDYSGVSFRYEGSEEAFAAYNIYGNASDMKENYVSFIPEQNNTFYYDLGETPSYWGADPDYEILSPEEPVKVPEEPQAYSVNALVDEIEERTDGNISKTPQAVAAVPEPGNPAQGQMVYFIDMYGAEKAAAGEEIPETTPGDPYGEIARVNIAFLKKGHQEPPVVNGSEATEDGEAYTMYEKREGVYTAPFPENVDSYSEIAFQTVGKDSQSVVKLDEHYNFRNEANQKWGHFKYTAGNADAFFLNRSQRESHWGGHPSVADVSLDTKVLYIDVADKTNNGVYADVNNLWIKWANMPEGTQEQIVAGEYDPDKGYKAVKSTTEETVRYFQFPYNSRATENTVLTITFSLTGSTSDTKEYTFRMMYVDRGGRNCLFLDNIWEFNGQMFGKFVVDPDPGEMRTVFFSNTDTRFEKIEMRTSTSENNWFLSQWRSISKILEESEFYKEELYGTQVARRFKYVQFRGKTSDGKWYYSNRETVSEAVSYPCYYAAITGSSSDNVPDNDVENPGITGYWRSVHSVDTAGDESINIPEGTFQEEENVYYARTEFYDYYSDWEMSGRKIKDWNAKDEYEYNKQALTFNEAAEKYYKSETVNWSEDQKNKFKALYLVNDVDYNYNNPFENEKPYWQSKGNWNKWTGGGNGPRSGLTANFLENGIICTPDGIPLPFFNEDFLRGNNNLETAVGNVYKNVLFPFTKDTNSKSRTYGYWTFDSNRAKDAMRLSEDVDEGYFLQRTGNPIAYNKGVNSFFPFNSAEDFDNPSNVAGQRSRVNELFGTRFEIDFKLTENAEIYNESKGKSEAIKFEFQGDDDTWIYVDGILALDLGGIHDAVRGEINFKDGTYTIWRAIKDTEHNNGYDGSGIPVAEQRPLNPELVEKLKDRSSQHTLTIFYMERGLYESNLKVSFNFPRQNKFSVEKEVDVTTNRVQNEADIFAGLLENMGAFPFELKNLVTSGETLPVEDSSGYIKPGESKPVYDETITPNFSFSDGAGTAASGDGKYIIEQNGNISGAVPEEKALLKITPESPVDVSNMQYLRMEMKNTGANDTSASNLYLSFVDGNGKRVGGYAGAMGYDGENNSFVKGEDTVIRVDFRQMTGDSGFSWSNVTEMFIGIRKLYEVASASYEISSIEFMGKTSENPTQGFAVEDNRISDYGSCASGMLTPVDEAWYLKKTRTGDTYNAGVSRATDNGEFSLADNQMAVFTDKFRTGSYLSLTEKNVNPKVFDTTWTVKENGQEIEGNYLLSTRDDMVTVVNPVHILTGNGYPLSNFKGTQFDSDVTVYDGRKAIISPEWNNSNFQTPDLKTTLVYRGYRDPDSSSNEATDIKVEVKNTLKRGSLTITKKLADSMKGDDGKFIPGDYTFDIYYTDIAGMGLESQLIPDEENQRYVRQTVTVHVDESGTGQKTVYNIPAGTMYHIVERPSNGATLVNIEEGTAESDHENVEILGIKETPDGKKDYSQAYVQGVAYTRDKEFIFTNENRPFYMDIAKVWKDGLTDTEREELFGIKEVYIQLQRRTVQEGTDAETGWEVVTHDFFDNVFGEAGKGYIKLTAGNNWKTTSKIPLPVSNEETGAAYEYRIQEIGSDGNLNYYEVSYEEEENSEFVPEDTEQKYLHITYKAVNATAGLQLKKEWDDRDDIAGIRPDKIRVKLMASFNWTEEKPESASWVCYESLSEENHKCDDNCYLELAEDTGWEKTVTRLPLRDSEGKKYYYRIEEEEMLYSWENEEQWIKIENDPYSYNAEYGKPQLPNIGNTAVLSVKNTLPLGNITISKKDEQTGKDLSGAEFKLERLITEENKEDFELKIDSRFSPRTGTTSETGMLYFQNLPYGKYKITEIKPPDGYVILKKPIYVTVDEEVFQKQAEEHKDDKMYNVAKKTITVTVKNSKFLELPESGGRGTFMFTLAGASIIGAALLLYRKKLKSAKKNNS